MRSKFSINIFGSIPFGLLLLFVIVMFLIEVVTTPSIAYMVKVGAIIISLLILILSFRIAKFRWNKIRIEDEALYISPFFGLWTNKVTWNHVTGIERAIQRGEDTDIKLLYILINNVRTVKILSSDYQNMYGLYRSLSRKTKVFGSEFIVLRHESVLEKSKSELWTSLVLGMASVVILGGGMYAAFEQIVFAKTAVRISGSVIEINIRDKKTFAVISFPDQQGHEHRFNSQVTVFQSFKQGEIVPVLFSPNLPRNARVDRFIERWLISLILSTVGLGLGIGSVWVWRRYSSPNK